MAKYLLTLTPINAEPLDDRAMLYVVDFDGEDQKAEEYLLSRKAVHLYRDMLHSLGKLKPPKAVA